MPVMNANQFAKPRTLDPVCLTCSADLRAHDSVYVIGARGVYTGHLCPATKVERDGQRYLTFHHTGGNRSEKDDISRYPRCEPTSHCVMLCSRCDTRLGPANGRSPSPACQPHIDEEGNTTWHR